MQEDVWQYRLPMLRLAASILRHPQNAEDAVSAAMVKALQKRHTIREEAALKPWLMQITARCAYDLLRKEKRQKQLPPQEAYALFECPEDSLFGCLRQLPKPYAEALTLYYYENFTSKEIARVLGIPEGTVRMRLARGRKLLRAIVEEEA